MNNFEDPSSLGDVKGALEPSGLDLWLSSEIDGREATDLLVKDTNSDEIARRRAQLVESARQISHVEPLDELTKARLIAVAVKSREASVAVDVTANDDLADIVPIRSRRSGPASWHVRVGSIAAAIALIAGVSLAIRNADLAREDAPLADSTVLSDARADSLEIGLRDLGDLTDPGALQKISREQTFATDRDSMMASDAQSYATTTRSNQEFASGDFANDPDSVEQACLGGLNPGGITPTMFGVGQYAGIAVIVATAIEGNATLTFVFDPLDCSIKTFSRIANS